MTISAINCTPIKPQVSFSGNEREKYDEINNLSDKVNDKLVNSKDIKSPFAIGASVALAGFAAYAGARGVVNTVTEKNFAKGAGTLVESTLQKGANRVKKLASDWSIVEIESKSKLKSSLNTLKKYAGKTIGFVEDSLRSGYKKIAYSGIPDETVNPERANKALANVVGTTAAGVTVAEICTKDSNNDGVVDIMQKSQNAYTGAKTTYGEAIDKVNTISEIIQTIA